MTDGKRRRRRGRRGRSGGQAEGAAPPVPAEEAAEGAEPAADASRPARRDTRRGRGAPPGPPPAPSAIRRAPPPEAPAGRRPREDRGPRRDDRGGRREERGGRQREGARFRSDDRRPFEPPVPQDPRSIELGAAFREAQQAVRDARKALDKRRDEAGDEPEWLVEQLEAAERRFAEVADEWVQHLEKTGRKIVRSR